MQHFGSARSNLAEAFFFFLRTAIHLLHSLTDNTGDFTVPALREQIVLEYPKKTANCSILHCHNRTETLQNKQSLI